MHSSSLSSGKHAHRRTPLSSSPILWSHCRRRSQQGGPATCCFEGYSEPRPEPSHRKRKRGVATSAVPCRGSRAHPTGVLMPISPHFGLAWGIKPAKRALRLVFARRDGRVLRFEGFPPAAAKRVIDTLPPEPERSAIPMRPAVILKSSQKVTLGRNSGIRSPPTIQHRSERVLHVFRDSLAWLLLGSKRCMAVSTLTFELLELSRDGRQIQRWPWRCATISPTLRIAFRTGATARSSMNRTSVDSRRSLLEPIWQHRRQPNSASIVHRRNGDLAARNHLPTWPAEAFVPTGSC